MSKSTQTQQYTDFFEEIPAVEVATPQVAEPVPETPTISEDAPVAPAPETPEAEEQNVPKSRFDAVYAESKNHKRELDEVKAALAKMEATKATSEPKDESPDLDPEAAAAIEKLLKAKGLMTRAEFDESQQSERAASQLRTDAGELAGWSKEQGYPTFDIEKVGEWATENNVSISSKTALKAAYMMQNQDAIFAAVRKQGTTASEASKATVEKPGGGTGKAPSAPEKGPMTTQERIREAMSGMNL